MMAVRPAGLLPSAQRRMELEVKEIEPVDLPPAKSEEASSKTGKRKARRPVMSLFEARKVTQDVWAV